MSRRKYNIGDLCLKGHLLTIDTIYTHPSDGSSKCKVCKQNYAKQYSKDHKDENRIRITTWRKQFPERERRLMREGHLRRKFGLLEKHYNDMLKQQHGKCAICQLAPLFQIDRTGRKSQTLCIDHCHISSKIRGLLCHNCNKGLGHFKDNAALLENAALYLRRF